MNMQAVGQLSGIEARNGGWFAVSVLEQGQQWPKKLSTKKVELVQQAQQLVGQMVSALYIESESQNINPNNGQPYLNRYLEQITLANGAPQFQGQPQGFAGQPAAVPFTPPPTYSLPQQPLPQPLPQPAPVLTQRVPEAERELRIHRQTASKVAAMMMSSLDPEEQNLASLLRISEQLVHYYSNGVPWQAPQPQPQPPHQPDYPGDPGPQGIPHDDEIPF